MPKTLFKKTYENTFKSIFDTYKDSLFSYVLAVSHVAYTAEEITREIFIKCWLCRDVLASIDNIEGCRMFSSSGQTVWQRRSAGMEYKSKKGNY